MKTVDISKYRERGARIFTDRDTGIKARVELQLEKIENEDDILILLPEDTWGINPSFFGGLFEASIKKMGAAFWSKYKFEYLNRQPIKESLKNSIDYAFEKIIQELGENE